MTAPAAADDRGRRDRGAVLPIVALLLPVLILMTAFAVDLGQQRSLRRTMQARADIVALDMVRLADGRSEQQILGAPGYATYLSGSASRNEVDTSKLVVAYGTINATAVFTETLANQVPNAVKVTASDTVEYQFRPGSGAATRSAVATSSSEAAFQIGTFAARIFDTNASQASILGLLGNALGVNAATDLVGYQGLANSNIPLGPLLTQLNVASPTDVATTSVSMRDFMIASAQVLRQSNSATDLANAQLLEALAPKVPSTPVQLGELVDLAPGGSGSALHGSVNALDLIFGAAEIANGSTGAKLNGLTIALPGLLQTKADLEVINGPKLISGPIGTTDTTGQVKTKVTARIAPALVPGLAALANAEIIIDLGTATATGTINDIICNPLAFTAGVQTDLLATRVEIKISLLGIPISIIALRDPPGPAANQQFVRTDDGTIELRTFTPPSRTLTQSGLGLAGASVTTQVGGLLGLVSGLLNPILAAITAPLGLLHVLDTTLLAPLLQQTGLNLGGTDVVPKDVTCGAVKLVG